jgi:integrase/recombinase XerD
MKSPARLYLRVRLPDGSYPYLKAAYASNGRLRSHHAVHNGKVHPFPGSAYYLRYNHCGKRVWESAGDDPSLALIALQRKTVELQAGVLGIALPATPVATEPASTPSVAPAPIPSDTRRPLAKCIMSYLAEMRAHKAKRTLAAYQSTLRLFAVSIKQEHVKDIAPDDISLADIAKQAKLAGGKLTPEQIEGIRKADAVKQEKLAAALKRVYVEDVTREDILEFATYLRQRGSAPRTVRNRIDFFQIFLHHFKLPSLLMGKDLPKYTSKQVRAYNSDELGKLFGHADQDESDLLHFLLCTGVREQEVQYACWSDVNLTGKAYKVTEHLDLGFRPKDKEEGTVPIPDLLVRILTQRRIRYPSTRLIFPGRNGKPNGHALRIIKSLALRAGVNCGHCINKKGQSCAEQPVCKHVLLHKMRKTFASVLHRNGLPARTLMRYLRHSDLETTLRYLADEDDDQTRGIVNSTFNGFGPARQSLD